MIHIVTLENRSRFYRELMDMHRQRKEVFVDQMRWPLTCEEGIEIDDFDTDAAIYLLQYDETQRLRVSARMLPTDQPHLLDTVFPHLCEEAVPRGHDIWEATRFCPAPDIETPNEKHALLGSTIAGILEAGLLFGVSAVTFVASGALKPLALAAGWDARALGTSVRHGRERLTACMASITPEGLRAVRTRYQLSGPLIRYAPAREAA